MGHNSLDDYALDTEVCQVYYLLMIRIPVLKNELAFLESHLPELEKYPELASLVAEYKKRIAAIHQEIQSIEKNK